MWQRLKVSQDHPDFGFLQCQAHLILYLVVALVNSKYKKLYGAIKKPASSAIRVNTLKLCNVFCCSTTYNL